MLPRERHARAKESVVRSLRAMNEQLEAIDHMTNRIESEFKDTRLVYQIYLTFSRVHLNYCVKNNAESYDFSSSFVSYILGIVNIYCDASTFYAAVNIYSNLKIN